MTEGIDLGLAIARFFTFGLAMLAFGQAVFDTAISARASTTRAARAAVGGAVALSALAYLTLLAGAASGSSPSPSLVAALAVSTDFGRALCVTAFAGLELVLWARPPGGLRLAFSAAGLGALTFVGHAAAGEGGTGALRLAVMALHLVAVGGWLGALPGLYLALTMNTTEAYPLLRRFGVLGVVAVSVVLASGLASLAFVAAQARWSLAAAYLGVLLGKLAVVAGLLVVAAVNRFWLTPLAKTDSAAALPLLRRSILIEQGLAMLAVATVAVLGQLDPAMPSM